MTLADEQRSLVLFCFTEEAVDDTLSPEAPDPRFRLYRRMVQDRLFGVITTALPRTTRHVGATGMRQALAAFLREAPPRTRFLRDVVGQFADHAPFAAAGTYAHALLTFERVCWETAYAPAPRPTPRPLDFAQPPILNPTLALLELGYPVQRLETDDTRAPGPTTLAVYRKFSNDTVNWIVLDAFSRAWLEAARISPERSIEALSRGVNEAMGSPSDGAFVDRLATTLTHWIEREVLFSSAS